MNIIVEFVICVIGCMTIGSFWLGNFGTVLGILIGLFLFYRLRKRKRKNIDYDRIEEMFNNRLGPPKWK